MDEPTKIAVFEKAMLPYLNDAYNLAAWMTRNSADSEDLVQEAFVKALRFFDGFRGGDARAWLLAIVRTTCLTWLKRPKFSGPVEPFDERTHVNANPTANAEQRLVTEADLASMRACIEALPLEYRETLVLRELQELSYKQIADTCAVPIGTIMSRLARARKRLQDCLSVRMGASK